MARSTRARPRQARRSEAVDPMSHERKAAGIDLQDFTAMLASPKASQNLKFEHEDWTSFRTLNGLQRKAGVGTKTAAGRRYAELIACVHLQN